MFHTIFYNVGQRFACPRYISQKSSVSFYRKRLFPKMCIRDRFTVRRVSYGVGVEKTFPIHSPHVEKVETVRHGKVRRAKLYYLRDRVGKRSKVKEQIV